MKISKALVACAAVAAMATPAAAIESDFTGFYQARGFMYENLDGDRSDSDGDATGIDQRFRLWNNTALHENVKAVFGLEIDTHWGEAQGGGDFGADERDIEIKNVYLDFNIPTVNTNVKVGVQPWQLGRGFILGDDASGIQVRYTPVEGQSLGLYFVKSVEGDVAHDGDDANYYQLQYDMKVGGWNVAPYLGYLYGGTAARSANLFAGEDDNLDVWFLGLNADGKIGPVTLAGTAIANRWDGFAGEDNIGLALWGKATYAVAPPTVLSVEAAYYGDDENGAFVNVGGYNNFSEIVTGGRFDARTAMGGDQTVTSFNTALVDDDNNPATPRVPGGPAVTPNMATTNDSYYMNFMYVKLGAEHKYSEASKVSAYYIYSQEAEDNPFRVDDDAITFGHELDLYYDREVVKGLTFTLAGAYLLADNDFGDGDDAWKLGTALTYKF